MQTITTIGFDIAKSVFQVHGVGAGGKVLIRRQHRGRTEVIGASQTDAFAPTRTYASDVGVTNELGPASGTVHLSRDETSGPLST